MKPRRLPLPLSLTKTLSTRISRSLQTAENAAASAVITSLLPPANLSPPPPPPPPLSSLSAAADSPPISGAQLTTSGFSSVPHLRPHLLPYCSSFRSPDLARKFFDVIPNPDLVSWSALISNYVRIGLTREALLAFKKMQTLGIRSNEFTLPTLLKACSAASDFIAGTQIHAVAIVTGFESDVFVANTLIVMYAGFGLLSDSRKLFDGIAGRNVVSWNALLAGHVKNDQCEEAVGLFSEMVMSGIRPNEFGFSCVLNACTASQDLRHGREVHGYLTRLGYDSDPFTSNALVDMYAKLGNINAAAVVFKGIARPDIVSWNAFIAGCVLHGHDNWALRLLLDMRRSGILPNVFTLSSILKACAGTGMLFLGQQIHGNLIKAGSDSDMFVGVGIVDMYAKCDHLGDARKAFDSIPEKDTISWNALISGCSHSGNDQEALFLFLKMRLEGLSFNRTTLSAILKSIASLQATNVSKDVHALALKAGFLSDPHVVNGLIDAYGKCNCIEEAAGVFRECSFGDVVAFTSIITAYSLSGQGEEAMKLFYEMANQELKPDSFALSSLLNACASLSAYEQGKQIHVHVLKMGFMSDGFSGNALVNMFRTAYFYRILLLQLKLLKIFSRQLWRVIPV
ncbi:putative pentatricopeptide repeat-containing protein [Cocos nucifera]|uniref:Putative pentatricopeptide repeat-containing protein n=1 Tax=Cocos nucifera TaxID=13894 RepID=A0A8K0IHH6_COCNU|nr:putative pentatricopeptide repeat-containing protein [Cocos nucifera]